MPRHSSGQELVELDARAAAQFGDPFVRQHEAIADELFLELDRVPEKRCSLLWRRSFDLDGTQGDNLRICNGERVSRLYQAQTRRQRLPIITKAILLRSE